VKFIIVIAIIAAAGVFGWKISNDSTTAPVTEAPPPRQVVGTDLPGMSPALETSLSAHQQRGAIGLRAFLDRYGTKIRDPRLAWIELDYVVLVARDNPVEAKRVFARIKKRIPSNSLVYPRVKQLEATYGQ
jgi:hypothetical protein